MLNLQTTPPSCCREYYGPQKNQKVEIITQLCFYAAGVAAISGIQISSAVQETSDIVLSICMLHCGYCNNRLSCGGTGANISHIEVITDFSFQQSATPLIVDVLIAYRSNGM